VLRAERRAGKSCARTTSRKRSLPAALNPHGARCGAAQSPAGQHSLESAARGPLRAALAGAGRAGRREFVSAAADCRRARNQTSVGRPATQFVTAERPKSTRRRLALTERHAGRPQIVCPARSEKAERRPRAAATHSPD